MMSITRRGLLLVLSSPSGAGKTTISRRVLEWDHRLAMSVSCTTRPRRKDEVDGVDYHFVEQPTFTRMVERGEFLEHARVFDHWYGTPRDPIESALAAGRDMVFDIDWQGTLQLTERLPDDLVRIFVLPPSTAELRHRLKRRAQDSDAVVEARMAKAADEMSHYGDYDYIVVNDDLDTSVRAVQSIVSAERLKRARLIGLDVFVAGLKGGNA
jgi:guanylate kinase